MNSKILSACLWLLMLNSLALAQPDAQLTTEAKGRRAGEEREDNGLKLKLVWCPAGNFKMGSPANDADAGADEQPQVDVALSRGFWLGKYEVTQGEWQSVMGTAPWKGKSDVKEGVNYPASYVDYDDALEFCRKLTETERRAGPLGARDQYTLPSEAQWEYACRAGTTTKYSFGNDAQQLGEYAWYEKNAVDIGERYAHPVGQKQPNAWGLHDLHGNVWEWCLDGYEAKLPGGRDPLVAEGSLRVLRGGSWSYPAWYARSAWRGSFDPSLRHSGLGFRLALSPSGE